MIYIFAALYQEAGSIIKKLSLKRRQPVLPFQQFEGEGVRLTITGAGQIKAASAVAAVLTERRPEKEDMLLSVGTCADITEYRENAIVSTGEGYIACKLRNLESGRVFYPDLILQMNFPLFIWPFMRTKTEYFPAFPVAHTAGLKNNYCLK